MAAIPNIEPEGYRFDSYIQELQEFFVTAGLSYGSAEDIRPLAAHLQSSGAFAEDLSSLVRSIILREGGAVARAQLLAILVAAISGEEIEHPPEHLKAPIQQMRGFVTDVLRKPWDEPMSGRVAQSAVPVSASRVGAEPLDAGPMDADTRGPDETPAQSRPPIELLGYSRSLAAALAAASPHSPPRDAERQNPEGADDLQEGESPEGLQQTLDLRPEIAAVPPTARSHTTVPTGRRMAWIAACAIPVALLLIFLWHTHDSNEIVTQVGPQTVVAARSAQPATNPTAKPSAGRAVSPDSPGGLRDQYGAARAARAGLSAASPGSSGLSTAAQAELPSFRPSYADAAPQPADDELGGVEARPYNTAPPAIGLGGSSRASSGAPRYLTNGRSSFEITSGVMSSHLIAARAPSYPFLARTANVQGEVMLQAVISRTGSVTAVHVLEGHRLLRGAAVAAVRHWRYRPYVADGRPVSVATIVTVDFRSHP